MKEDLNLKNKRDQFQTQRLHLDIEQKLLFQRNLKVILIPMQAAVTDAPMKNASKVVQGCQTGGNIYSDSDCLQSSNYRHKKTRDGLLRSWNAG
jgi:hypothetical protein